MLSRLRNQFSSSHDDYIPVQSDDGPNLPPLEIHRQRPQRGEMQSRSGTLVVACFWALGAGILLSWNALICTYPLFTSFFLFGATRSNLASYLSTVYCFSNLLFLGIAQRNVGKTPPTKRLRWSLVLMLITMLIVVFPLLSHILPAMSTSGSPLLLPVLLLIVLALSLSTSYLQSAVFALAALWGPKETLAVMSGQGGVACIVSLVQVFLAMVESKQALWFIGALGCIACIAALRYLVSHPDYVIVLAPLAQREVSVDVTSKDLTKRVFVKNIPLEFAVAFVFTVTLAIFPPITTTIMSASRNPPWILQPVIFIAIHFFIFNFGDYIGRTFIPAMRWAMSLSTKQIVILSCLRVVFFPLFLLCNTPARAYERAWVFPDAIYFLILFIFGITNGAVGSICMIFASSPELNPVIGDEEKDLAGTLAAFSLVAGLAFGSLCSFAVNYAINGNPFGG